MEQKILSPEVPEADKKQRRYDPRRDGVPIEDLGPLVVTLEKQGDGKHSTPIPEGLRDVVHARLAEHNLRGAWHIQMRSVHVRGHAHHLKGDVRAIEITTYRTLHIIAQSNGADSRRRCDLTPPKGVPLDYVFQLLRPELVAEAMEQEVDGLATFERLKEQMDPTKSATRKVVSRTANDRAVDERRAMNLFRSKPHQIDFIEAITPHVHDLMVEARVCNEALSHMWVNHFGSDSHPPLKAMRFALMNHAQIIAPSVEGWYPLTEGGVIYYERALEDRHRRELEKARMTHERAIESLHRAARAEERALAAYHVRQGEHQHALELVALTKQAYESLQA